MTLTRRSLLSALASAPFWTRTPVATAANGERPLVGAIRWDAWYDPDSAVTQAVENALSQKDYEWRAPFFAQVEGGRVLMPKISQAQIDLEIVQAAYAGLDYWAFVAYSAENSMSLALKHYLASAMRARIRFCLFSELARWGSREAPGDDIRRHFDIMRSDSYVTVEDGRPLYFLGFIDEAKIRERWESVEHLRDAIGRFRLDARGRGLSDPYIVMAGSVAQIPALGRALGADAVGAYAISDGKGIGSFAQLSQLAEQGWATLGRSGLPVVPTVMTGWDRRPRVERPVPWEKGQKPGAGIQYHFGTASPDQISEQLRTAMTWVASAPKERRAPAILIYAWNENDEGGWLIPTRECDARRLDALKRVLAPSDSHSNPGCQIDGQGAR